MLIMYLSGQFRLAGDNHANTTGQVLIPRRATAAVTGCRKYSGWEFPLPGHIQKNTGANLFLTRATTGRLSVPNSRFLKTSNIQLSYSLRILLRCTCPENGKQGQR
jgi:hypothetical protein